MKIVHLIDVPEVLPVLARLFVAEWAPWYGPDGPGDAKADLNACASRDALPLCLVALDDQGEILGTAALKAGSVGGELAPGPWLAALLVTEDHRKKGVGTALVESIEIEARRLGFGTLYTSTDAADTIMVRRGWQKTGETASLRGPITVFRRGLNTKTG